MKKLMTTLLFAISMIGLSAGQLVQACDMEDEGGPAAHKPMSKEERTKMADLHEKLATANKSVAECLRDEKQTDEGKCHEIMKAAMEEFHKAHQGADSEGMPGHKMGHKCKNCHKGCSKCHKGKGHHEMKENEAKDDHEASEDKEEAHEKMAKPAKKGKASAKPKAKTTEDAKTEKE